MSDQQKATRRRESIVVENDLPDSPERVWRALTDPSLLEAWLMPNNIRAEVGARFQFRTAPAPGWSIVDCEVLEVVPHRLLVYSWRSGSKAIEGGADLDTVVTWRLTPLENGGTRLYFEHSGFDPDSAMFKAMGQGWKGKISEKIRRVLAAQSGGDLFRVRNE
ncbi:MAG TPA: SRPBCC domain-containing protein [Terriglobales bacterium]|nr:SRPBCC domain-containing protein [Terriglobales bacterium]